MRSNRHQHWQRWFCAACVGGPMLFVQAGCTKAPRLTMTGFGPALSWQQKPDPFNTPDDGVAPEAFVQANVAVAPEKPAADARLREERSPFPNDALVSMGEPRTGIAKTQPTLPRGAATNSAVPPRSDDPFADFGMEIRPEESNWRAKQQMGRDPEIASVSATQLMPPVSQQGGLDLPPDMETSGLPRWKPTEAAEAASSRKQQLREALYADTELPGVERDPAAPVGSESSRPAASSPEIARAESLMDRARQLLRLGYLHEARRAAQQANALADAFQLDFPTVYESPSTLLSQIETLLQSKLGVEVDEPATAMLTANATSSTARKFDAQADLLFDPTQPQLPSGQTLTPSAPAMPPIDQPPVPVRPRESMMAANRPVRVASSTVPPTGLELPSPNADTRGAGQDTIKLPDMPALPLPGTMTAPDVSAPSVAANAATSGPVRPRSARELQPFRGDDGPWPTDVPLTSPKLVSEAPSPPQIDDFEPSSPVLGSVSTTANVPASPVSPGRALFSGRSIVWGLGMVGLICLISGCGLLARRLRELRETAARE